MESMAAQYAVASGMAVKYIGGSYMSRVERGQPGDEDPVDPVPAGSSARPRLPVLARVGE
jgi:hypothetical protein